jgi:tRNA-splicing ligase RtcB
MELQKLDEHRWLIPKSAQPGMRVDVVVYASQALLEAARRDASLQQAANVATLPGVIEPALVMPDVHQGYGFPIGGVAAMDFEHGVVSPGGVGFDIN